MGKDRVPEQARNSLADGGGAGAPFPIVGIGMSAGGLEAATQFLNAMPADSGMAFVIVQHLEPTRKSLLAELLGKQTKMPVVEIEDGMRAEPNRVHVIVPAKTLLIEKGILKLVAPEEPRGQRHPIDKFFTALAAEGEAKAIGIILTGAGSNGTPGLLDIKQAGGLCIAQDPETAKFDSMPRNAIASGAVDYVLAPDKMPEALLGYVRHPYVDGGGAPEALTKAGKADLSDVLTLVRARSGHDLRQYKHNTLLRRTHRRMGLAHIERLEDYVNRLRDDADELTALVKDLMINVTGFFRDPDAWDALDRSVIAPLVEKAVPNQALRVWVPACSTGEEAYSIAMLLTERAEESGKDLGLKVFATDVGDYNLGPARKGSFPGSMVESLSPERLKRFFDKNGDTYRVKADIRETVLFAPQNLLTDPPYSKMDLVSCRNLLIYLQPDAQERVLSLAHFALREGGYLFLGNAETIGGRDHLFAPVSKRWRIYQRIGPARSSAIDFSTWPTRDFQNKPAADAPKLADIAIRALAERYGPASVVIDKNYRVHHFHGLTEDYLAQPPGSPTLDLLTLARDGLGLTIRRTVQKAIDDGDAATFSTGRTSKSGKVAVTACPIADAGSEKLFLVTFAKEATASRSAPADKPGDDAAFAEERDFEQELKAARDDLRTTIEQFETANEELKASNEEVTSVNEELQATNEELESSKEELQSLNEELNAVNAQLERKVIELEEAGDDLRNLLAGNDVATIFLDSTMRIKWFTPAVKTLFDLIDQDIGRPIMNFAQKFAEGDLVGKAEAAIARLATFEEEVKADSGKCFMLRVQPYRTGDNRIAGAVASFIDVTELKEKQAEIANARDYAEAVVRTIHNPLLVLTDDLRVKSANPAFYNLFQVRPAETEGRPLFELGDGQWDIPELRALLDKLLPSRGSVTQFEVDHEFPAIGQRCMLLNASRIAGDAERPDLILLAIEDATERLGAERHQGLLVGELSHRVKNTLAVVQSVAEQTLRHSGSLANFSEAFLGRLHALGRAHDMVIGSGFRTIPMGSIIAQALKPFRESGQIEIGDGPTIELGQVASQSLTMMLHELATNAVKYGGLSTSEGKVTVDWRIEADGGVPRIVVTWAESGGPAVEAPLRSGQGTRFIERSVAYEMRGKANFEFRREGVEVVIDFPIHSATAKPGSAPRAGQETA